jgi:hypothetical protein
MVLVLMSGVIALAHPTVSVAEEQPAYSPRETLAWPRATDARHARQLPLMAFDGHIAARVHLVRESTSVAVYDPRSNQVYSGGDAGPIAGASLSKVLMAVIALQQLEQRGAGDDEVVAVRAVIYPTIAYSDNDVANDIWEMIGRQPAVDAFASEFGLSGFSAPDPWDWGQVSATARDWAILFAMLGSGQLLNEDNTAALLSMMDNVIEEHRWGVLTRRDDSVSFGKNGWYLDEDESFVWRVNSAGFVSVAEPDANVTPRVVVVLTRYPGQDGMSYGVDLATRITASVINCTHAQHSRSTLRQRSESCTTNRETAMLMDRAYRIW